MQTRWVVDLDGVVYRGRELLPGAARFFERVGSLGQRLVVVTNNSTATAEQYRRRLAASGIRVGRQQVVTSALAAAHYLKARGLTGSVLAIGERGVVGALQAFGIPYQRAGRGVARPGAPFQAVVVGLDRRFTYAKLAEACQAVRAGAALVATNPDATLPAEGGALRPGCGSLLAAIAACSGQQPVVVGKPNRPIMELALKRLGVAGEAEGQSVVVVGDRLDTDVAAARAMGLRGVLVLTGVASRADLASSPVQPDAVFENLEELTRAWLEGIPSGALS